MRIVHTCLRYPPATGGVEAYVRDVVLRTRNIEEGRDVRVVTSSMRTHGPISLLHPDTLLDDPPYVQRTHVAATPWVSYPRLQGLGYYLLHHQPDIIHGYSYWYQPADVAARVARRNGIPFIFHPMFYYNAHRKKLVWCIYQQLRGRATFAAADAVAVISPYEQKAIEEAGMPVKRFVLLPPGIDSMAIYRQRPNPYVARGVAGPVILCVGRLSRGKGFDQAIKVFARIKRQQIDAELVIIGEDFGEAGALKKIVADLSVAGIHFWGRVESETLFAAYQHAAVFLQTSYYEAFGIAAGEASAAGTPVVARDVAAVPYVVQHGRTGFLFNSEDELYRALSTLLASPETRATFGEAGRVYIQENFSWETTINRLLTLYGEFGREQREHHARL